MMVSGTSRKTLLESLQDHALIGADLARQLSENVTSEEELHQQLLSDGILTRFQIAALESGELSTLMVGNYLIVEELGKGGMGVVYLAKHRRLKRKVALKILPPKLVSNEEAFYRFQRETEVLARLQHTHIAMAYDADEYNGIHYLAMEYIDGCNLSQKVRRDGPLSITDAVEMIKQAALGLDYIHSNGIIHRDVKPSNMIVDRKGQLKILDVGLAKIFEERVVEDEITQFDFSTANDLIMGTMAYMAPEQALDSRSADLRADIYSLGCTLFYLLTGQTVFSQRSNAVVNLISHAKDEPPHLTEFRPDCPEALDRMFQKMLKKQPDDRYQRMSEVIDVCQRLQESCPDSPPSLDWESSEPPDDSVPPTINAKLVRHSPQTKISLGILAGLLVVIGMIWWASSRHLSPNGDPGNVNSDWPPVAEFSTNLDQIAWINGIAFGPGDQSILVAGGRHDDRPSTEYPLLVHSLPDGDYQKLDQKISSWTRVMEVSPDHRFLAIGTGGDYDEQHQQFRGGGENALFVWDLATLELVSTHLEHAAAVRALAFLPDRDQIFSGGPDGSLFRWTIGSDGEPVVEENRGQILSLAVSPDGSTMAVGRWDDVTVRDVGSGEKLFSYPVSKSLVLRFSPTGDLLAIADENHEILVLDVFQNKVVVRFTEHTDRINCLHWYGKTPYLLSASEDETVKVWDLQHQALEKSLPSSFGGIKCLAFSRETSQIAAGTDEGKVLVWEHSLR